MGAFEIMYQTVDAGGFEGVAADEEGLNGEGLAEARIAQVACDHVPYGFIISQTEQGGHLPQHGHETMKRLSGKLLEADLVDFFRMG